MFCCLATFLGGLDFFGLLLFTSYTGHKFACVAEISRVWVNEGRKRTATGCKFVSIHVGVAGNNALNEVEETVVAEVLVVVITFFRRRGQRHPFFKLIEKISGTFFIAHRRAQF